MRSVMATAAAAWFVFGAVVIGDGSSGTIGEAPNQAVIGDPVGWRSISLPGSFSWESPS